ncbi:Hypp9564 [Branchiostoma lanceolatum]|uniref:Hypp9564 protein n=1 Tax=Branchiostoma lanceolatum TaxID=7740 RepID=A0A8S4MP37_BRALA|nr:Hypp9564 [Branchiostoma lanceolatum]
MAASLLACTLLVLLTGVRGAGAQLCQKVDACSCKLDNGTVVSLHSLANTDGGFAFKTDLEGNTFWYNPCFGFDQGSSCHDVSLCANMKDDPADNTEPLGIVQPDAITVINSTTVAFKYKSGFSLESEVYITCDEQATQPVFLSHGTDPDRSTRYVFSLTSAEVCARHAQCKQVDRCTCTMDDGTGNLNLHTFSRPEKPWEITVPDGTVYYNPCVGVGANISDTCKGAAVCLKQGDKFVNLGSALSGVFVTDEDGDVILEYHNLQDEAKTTKVTLTCDPSARVEPVFENPSLSENHLSVTMKSVCACAGSCMFPARTCTADDSCSCKMSDGSGTVSLHALDNPAAAFKDVATTSGVEYTFYYNPCSGLTIGLEACMNVSGCAYNHVAQRYTALGTVQPDAFTPDEGRLIIAYSDKQSGMSYNLTLVCDIAATNPKFAFTGIRQQNSYDFMLTTRCACADECAVNGSK